MRGVEWEDLLKRRFQLGGRGDGPLDCAGVSEEILVRLGKIERDSLVIPPYATNDDVAELDAGEFLSMAARRFERIGDQARHAIQIGDLALTEDDQHHAHFSVLVDRNPRTWLTAAQKHGVRSCEDRHILNVCGIYRVVPA